MNQLNEILKEIDPHKPLFLVGPTASGKSEIAMQLARKRNAAILCMDAMQVYIGADIGTGKPTREERAQVLHGGLDLVEIGQPFSVVDYLRHAEAFLNECRTRQQPVIIVGGTGLYYRALTYGLSRVPPASEKLREELSSLSVKELQNRLNQIDPNIMPTLDIQNPRRLARAIEVKETTGISLQDWHKEPTAPLVNDFTAYLIERPKEELHQRIEERVDSMLDNGWKAEVDALAEKYGEEIMKNFVALGYSYLVEYDVTHEKIREKIITQTKRYAKRQLTWFKRELNLKKLKLSSISSNPGERLS